MLVRLTFLAFVVAGCHLVLGAVCGRDVHSFVVIGGIVTMTVAGLLALKLLDAVAQAKARLRAEDGVTLANPGPAHSIRHPDDRTEEVDTGQGMMMDGGE